jgi:hypothetical protein
MEPWIPRTRLVVRLRRSGTEPADDRELKGRLLSVWQNSAAEPEYQYKSDPSHVALRRRYDHAKRSLGLPAIFAIGPLLLRKRTCACHRHRSQKCQQRSSAALDFHRQDRTSFAWRTHSIASSAMARCRRTAEQRDEFAAPDHSITSSARARSDSGMVSPSALAVVRLITSSNLVGCSTGKSPGFAPRKILST